MESSNKSVFDNDRRVTKDIKVIKTIGEQDDDIMILCSDSMYGSSVMDGKVKILKL
jgi:hypothetical protein